LNALREDPSIVHHARLAGWTPIFYAVRSNEISVVNELLKNDADPHVKNTTGTSAYAIAIQKIQGQCIIENNDVLPS